jgi:DivIVA domain-containing protein
MVPGSHLGSGYSEGPEARGPAAGRNSLARLGADDVRNVRFSSTKLREGYKLDEVDAFLDRVELQLRSGGRHRSLAPLTAEAVIEQRFTATRFRAGYDQDEVDDFLDRIVTELRREG